MAKETRKEALKRVYAEELAANPGVPPRRSVVVKRIGNGMGMNFNGELAKLWRDLQFGAGFVQGRNGRFRPPSFIPGDIESVDAFLRRELAAA